MNREVLSRVFSVRAAGGGDLHAIADLHARSRSVGFASFLPAEHVAPSPEELVKDWANRMAENEALDRLLLVAEAEKGLVGVLEAGRDPADVGLGRIARCYIDPHWWDSKVASRLFDAGIEHLRSIGCTAAVCWVIEQNERVQARLRHKGMIPSGLRQRSCEAMVPFGLEDVQYRMGLHP